MGGEKTSNEGCLLVCVVALSRVLPLLNCEPFYINVHEFYFKVLFLVRILLFSIKIFELYVR